MSAAAASQDLEAAYDQSKWAPNMQDAIARHGILSEATRKAIGLPTRISYGSGPDEGLDLFRAGGERAPIVVFVHGGGWRGGSAKDHAFPAEMLLAAGAHFIGVDFSSVGDTNGDLSVLVDQVRRAVAWIHRNGLDFGGDANRLFVVGHSSGAHLAAMALSTHWADYGLPENPVRGGFLVSGIYDLAPLRQTSRSRYAHIDDRIERELSPLQQIGAVLSPVLLAVGTRESPEFQRQAHDYATAARRSGKPTKVIVAENYNHFDILETLGNPYGILGRSLLEFMRVEDI